MDPGSSTSHGTAFAEVYRQHHTYVWRTLRCMSVVDSALDDATQDVFMVVHRRLPEWEGRAAVRTWLFEIVRRVASRYRTAASRDAARTFELPELAGATDLDEAVAHAMAREVLRAFLDALDEDRLRVFVLAEIWGLRGREIAEELGVNQNTAYARLQSARDELDRWIARLRAKEARTVLRTMRRARPSRESRARTWRALVVGLGLPTKTVSVAMGASLGWGLVGGLAGAAVIFGVVATRPEPARADAVAHDVATNVRADAVPVGGGREAIAGTREPTDAIAATDVQVVSAPARPAEQAVRPRGGSSSRPGRAEAEAQGGAAADPEPPSAALAAEVRLVQRIRGAVAARQASARALIDRYRADFSQGTLRQEVEALATELSCIEAPARAAVEIDAFARRFPGSGLLARLRTVCAGPG